MKYNESEWVKPSVDVPQDEPRYKTLSIEVDILLRSGKITHGFYNNENGKWYCWKQNEYTTIAESDMLGWRTKLDEKL